jgi:hypothetical protein
MPCPTRLEKVVSFPFVMLSFQHVWAQVAVTRGNGPAICHRSRVRWCVGYFLCFAIFIQLDLSISMKYLYENQQIGVFIY